VTKIALAVEVPPEVPPNEDRAKPKWVKPRITAAPRIRQVYWCTFWEDTMLPEMWKERPVVIVSYKNKLHGHCLVLPTSTDPQEGESAEWAHKLSFQPDGARDCWVVCNHLYTVSTSRLAPSKVIPRVTEGEFNQILGHVLRWVPKLPTGDGT
jgi:mRNA interferase MazF